MPDEVDGLLLLPADAPVGAIRDYLDLDDHSIGLKITPTAPTAWACGIAAKWPR